MRSILFIIFITVVVSGCATGTITSGFKPKGGGQSVFVFKVDPAKKIVFFFEGKEENGVFKQNRLARATFKGRAQDGYVVFKATPGETLGLTQYAHKSFGFKNSAWPCEDYETISFTVPSNEVLYMTDIALGEKGEAFNLGLTQNFDQAKIHLQRYFPKLAPSLKQGTFKMIQGERSCDEEAAVPIARARVKAPEAVAPTINTSTNTAAATIVPPERTSAVTDARMEIVQNYVAAFDAQDTSAMMNMVTDDVQWLNIDGETIVKNTNSKEELREAMMDYFKSCSTCKSRLAQVFSTGSRVSALEVVSFQSRNGPEEERSVSLYEFSGSLISRVYYFPSDK